MSICRSVDEAYAAGHADAQDDPPPTQAQVDLAYALTRTVQPKAA